ncbi:hypothetical protein DFP73DRAFT_553377 [Morchella snyderi]|nr:hypothetical protein DFP73DRAFT_553377 [Morchella snyderi]
MESAVGSRKRSSRIEEQQRLRKKPNRAGSAEEDQIRVQEAEGESSQERSKNVGEQSYARSRSRFNPMQPAREAPPLLHDEQDGTRVVGAQQRPVDDLVGAAETVSDDYRASGEDDAAYRTEGGTNTMKKKRSRDQEPSWAESIISELRQRLKDQEAEFDQMAMQYSKEKSLWEHHLKRCRREEEDHLPEPRDMQQELDEAYEEIRRITRDSQKREAKLREREAKLLERERKHREREHEHRERENQLRDVMDNIETRLHEKEESENKLKVDLDEAKSQVQQKDGLIKKQTDYISHLNHELRGRGVEVMGEAAAAQEQEARREEARLTALTDEVIMRVVMDDMDLDR